MNSAQVFLLFLMYSFVGWFCEVIYCSFFTKKLVNRGFLKGPICPVYGFGALLIMFALKPVQDTWIVLFVMAVLVTSVLEYATSWFLEKVFATKWWDYSNYRFQIKGRVCLVNSVLFGVMAVVCVKFVQPFFVWVISLLNQTALTIVSASLAVIFIVDLVYTVLNLVNIGQKLTKLQSLLSEIKVQGEKKSLEDILASYRREAAEGKETAGVRFIERMDKIAAWNKQNKRLLKAFPSMQYLKLNNIFSQFKETPIVVKSSHLLAHFKEAAQGIKEKRPTGFAKGLGFYKIFWIFVVGSIIGTIIETLWCMLQYGYMENRSAVLYGPFNLVYGFGAVGMTLLLWRIRNKRDLVVIFGGMAIGGVVEYVTSVVQELAFGSVSWDYSDYTLNIGGRTNLLYSFFWGILGLLWIKNWYPQISIQIEKTPKILGKILTYAMLLFLVYDGGLSVLALNRQNQRHEGIVAETKLQIYLDENFTDEYLKKVYPNMENKHEKKIETTMEIPEKAKL